MIQRRLRVKFILLTLLCISLQSLAIEDSIHVETRRSFDQNQLESYKRDSDFRYVHEGQKISWTAGIYEWLVNWLSDFFEDKYPSVVASFLNILIKIILWSLVIIAIGLLVYSLYKQGLLGVWGKNKQSIGFEYRDLEDKVIETDWQRLIGDAIKNQQYNLAIRLLFLQLLQSLNSAGCIEWNKSKSIRDYYIELKSDNRPAFSSLAKIYQYSWFGGVLIDQSHFEDIQREFEAFEVNEHVEKV